MEKQVILAALEEMKIHSFRFTMEDLAKRMHVSKSTLYKIVSSKEDLVHCILDYIINAFITEREKVLSHDAAVEEKLNSFIYAYTKAFQYFEHGVYSDLKMSYPDEWTRWENFRQEQIAQFMELFDEGVRQGVFRPLNSAVIKRCLLVMSASLAEPMFLEQNGLAYKQAIDSMSDLIFHGITQRERVGK